MKTKFILTTILLLLPTQINALLISDINVEPGSFLNNSINYFETDTGNFEPNSILHGTGTVTAITNGSNILWTHGTNGVELNYIFDNILISESNPITPIFNEFQLVGGVFDFFVSNLNTYTPSDDFKTDVEIISNGTPWLNLIINDAGSNEGQIFFVPDEHGSFSLQLDVDISKPGLANANFDNTDRPHASDQLANFSFGVNDTQGLAFSGSGNFRGSASDIPSPDTLFLIGIGVLLIVFKPKKYARISNQCC